MESMIGQEIYANYGAMHSEHYGLVTGVKTTTVREESMREVKVWWFEAGESSGETSWIPECTIRTEEEVVGSPIGFFWQTRPMLPEEFSERSLREKS